MIIQPKDGTAVRDYLHVVDLADAHLKGFAERLIQKRALCVI